MHVDDNDACSFHSLGASFFPIILRRYNYNDYYQKVPHKKIYF